MYWPSRRATTSDPRMAEAWVVVVAVVIDDVVVGDAGEPVIDW